VIETPPILLDLVASQTFTVAGRDYDVGAKAEIQERVVQLARDGVTVVFISSELEELVGYADRVIIMRDRKQVAEIPLAELSVPAIMNAIAA